MLAGLVEAFQPAQLEACPEIWSSGADWVQKTAASSPNPGLEVSARGTCEKENIQMYLRKWKCFGDELVPLKGSLWGWEGMLDVMVLFKALRRMRCHQPQHVSAC